VEPSVAVMFMSGIVLTIVGSSRAVSILMGRGVMADDSGGTQPIPIPIRVRSDIARLLWVAVALYGLFLAASGVILGR
jgi:hypothetical protein